MAEGKVRIITLGCAKNEVDSEEIAGVLQQNGFKIDAESRTTDVTIINTCGFLEASKAESIQAIKDAIKARNLGKTGKVIVAGCLTQRLGSELFRLAPGADAYVGVGQMGRFEDIVRDTLSRSEPLIDLSPPHHRWADVATRARSGYPWSAYLKVSEGCDHKCTFCTIPSFRGKHDSKPIERVVAEATHLSKQGTREVNLIAQDVTQYGYDLYKKFTLPSLLHQLNAVEALDWIRILYFYPNRLTDEVIEAMATLPKITHYIDIPLQHAHPETLRRMKRPWDGDRYLALFEKVRKAMPDVAIRTTFIVGFPGETDEEFDYLIDFVKAARLDRVGAFQFSPEPGTPAAEMDGQISNKIRRQRFDRLMTVQQKISKSVNNDWVGKEISVLVESERDGWKIGRSHRDAPDIDGLVFFKGEAQPGEIVRVEVQDAEPYDLFGSQVGSGVKVKKRLEPLRVAVPSAPK
jgi:ribosomal protein S12 methylthiotransferase